MWWWRIGGRAIEREMAKSVVRSWPRNASSPSQSACSRFAFFRALPIADRVTHALLQLSRYLGAHLGTFLATTAPKATPSTFAQTKLGRLADLEKPRRTCRPHAPQAASSRAGVYGPARHTSQQLSYRFSIRPRQSSADIMPGIPPAASSDPDLMKPPKTRRSSIPFPLSMRLPPQPILAVWAIVHLRPS